MMPFNSCKNDVVARSPLFEFRLRIVQHNVLRSVVVTGTSRSYMYPDTSPAKFIAPPTNTFSYRCEPYSHRLALASNSYVHLTKTLTVLILYEVLHSIVSNLHRHLPYVTTRSSGNTLVMMMRSFGFSIQPRLY